MLGTVFLVVFTTLIAIVAAKAFRAARYWRDRGIPHETLLSALYTNFVRFQRENVYDILAEHNGRYGLVYGTYSGFTPILRVSSIEGIRDALVRNFSSLHERALFVPTGSPLWDNNLVVLEYGRWKTVRHISGASLTSSKLKAMVPKIERISRNLLRRMAEVPDDIEVLVFTKAFNLDVVAAVAYGLDLETLADFNNPFVINASQTFAPSLGLALLTSMPGLISYLPFVHFPLKKVSDFFTGFTSALIEQRRQQGQNRQPESGDILDLWLSEQQKRPDELTDEVIASQVFLFFVAGFETSSFTLALTLFLLACRPEIQDAAYEEIRSATEGRDELSFEDYNRLKLVEACLIETLRMVPTDFVLDRKAVASCTVAGVVVEPGIGVQVPVPAVHRRAELFPEPQRYQPQRFVSDLNPFPSVDSSKQLAAMMTFGDGPKGCLGRRLALLQMTIGLTAILKRFRLRPSRVAEKEVANADKLPFKISKGAVFLPYPAEPLFIKLEPRL